MAAKLSYTVFFVFCLQVSSSNHLGLFAGDKCKFDDGAIGICTPDIKCPSALELFRIFRIRPVICGYESFTSIVCCPSHELNNEPLTEELVYRPAEKPQQIGERCTLRDGSGGVCQDIPASVMFYQSLKEKNARPVLCNDAKWPIYCYPDNINDLTAPIFERISVTKCKEYHPDNFSPFAGGAAFAYGGSKVIPSKYPHMAALGWLLAEGDGQKLVWNCGATLISENFVLTAAHCTAVPDTGTYQRLEPVVVRLGVIYLTSQFENGDIEIESIIIHPLYSPPLKYHDIALMRLKNAPTFSSSIKPICLHQSFSQSGFSTAAGWGRTAKNGPQSVDLLEVFLNVVNNTMCSDLYQQYKKGLPNGIIDGQICAGHPEGEQDTCQGDSGGPLHGKDVELYDTDTIIGITSFGIGCGKVKIPGVYTRVSAYIDWIESIVWPGL